MYVCMYVCMYVIVHFNDLCISKNLIVHMHTGHSSLSVKREADDVTESSYDDQPTTGEFAESDAVSYTHLTLPTKRIV